MSNNSTPGVLARCPTTGTAGGINLDLPPTVTDSLEGAALTRVNMILLEYARDAALLQSRGYDAVLRAISAQPDE
jgi:hypothetical protein